MKKLIFSVIVVNILVGCSANNTSVYPGTGLTHDLSGDPVEVLGQVKTCKGAFCTNEETGNLEWALSLSVPPPASTYQAALRKKAAIAYKVPEIEIVIGEITVGYHTELNGVIRGWNATALVGRKKLIVNENTEN